MLFQPDWGVVFEMQVLPSSFLDQEPVHVTLKCSSVNVMHNWKLQPHSTSGLWRSMLDLYSNMDCHTFIMCQNVYILIIIVEQQGHGYGVCLAGAQELVIASRVYQNKGLYFCALQIQLWRWQMLQRPCQTEGCPLHDLERQSFRHTGRWGELRPQKGIFSIVIIFLDNLWWGNWAKSGKLSRSWMNQR